MKVLVTGGAGFIGSHTIDMLVENGHKVVVLDNLEPQVHQNKKPEYLNPDAEYIWGDVKNKEDWLKVLKDIDVIFHLAAMVGVGQSMYQPVRYLRANTIGTANMYEVIMNKPEIKKRIQKIIVASSKSIYGEGAYECRTHGVVYPNLRPREQLEKKDWEVHCPLCDEYVKPVGITEKKPPQNLSTYALSKFDTERIALNYGHAFQIPTIAFRYFNVYGSRGSLNNPYTNVAAIFISRVKNKKPPIIYEDGNQVRDFIYVEDIARVNLLALEKGDKTDVYNVGTGVSTSVLDIADTVIDIYGSNVEPKVTEEFRVGDNRHDFADISKIRKDLGFKPKWKLKRGFEKLVEWSETQEAVDMFERAERERKKYLGR